MNNPMSSPPFFSLTFHIKFFPNLLKQRLSGTLQSFESRPSLEGHMPLEWIALGILSLILALWGTGAAMLQPTMLRIAVASLGWVGCIVLMIMNLRSGITRPSYDSFELMPFFFLVFLGLSAGLFFGSLHHSLLIMVGAGIPGLIIGYLLGIGAGLGTQFLGWMAGLINIALGALMAGLAVLDAILLYTAVLQ